MFSSTETQTPLQPKLPHFIEIGNVVIQTTHIAFVDFREEGRAIINLGSGNTITAEGDAAQGLRRFFLPQPVPEASDEKPSA